MTDITDKFHRVWVQSQTIPLLARYNVTVQPNYENIT